MTEVEKYVQDNLLKHLFIKCCHEDRESVRVSCIQDLNEIVDYIQRKIINKYNKTIRQNQMKALLYIDDIQSYKFVINLISSSDYKFDYVYREDNSCIEFNIYFRKHLPMNSYIISWLRVMLFHHLVHANDIFELLAKDKKDIILYIKENDVFNKDIDYIENFYMNNIQIVIS